MEVMTMVESGPTQVVQTSPGRRCRASRSGSASSTSACTALVRRSSLSVLVIPKVDVPDWATLPPVRAVVFWVGAHVFRLTTPLVYSGSGSGDKYFDWVLVFCSAGVRGNRNRGLVGARSQTPRTTPLCRNGSGCFCGFAWAGRCSSTAWSRRSPADALPVPVHAGGAVREPVADGRAVVLDRRLAGL